MLKQIICNFKSLKNTNLNFYSQIIKFNSKNENKKSDEKSKLDLDEYNGQEFNRTKDDAMDHTKPYENLEQKIFHPELREQMEKRKDIYHTLDTKYYKEELEKEKLVKNVDQNVNKSDQKNKDKNLDK